MNDALYLSLNPYRVYLDIMGTLFLNKRVTVINGDGHKNKWRSLPEVLTALRNVSSSKEQYKKIP